MEVREEVDRMVNKKILYGIALSFGIIAVASYFLFGGTSEPPVKMFSAGMWDPKVLELSYLTENADSIVVGRVKDVLPSKWNTPDGKRPEKIENGYIYTDIVIEVYRYLKNPQDTQEIVVRTLGGTVDEDSMEFKDEAKFEVGEKVLVFLTKEDPFTANISPEHYRILSWKHGKFRLTEDGLAIRENVPPAYRVIPLQDIEKAIRKSGGNRQ
jgi:hypothetical protein